ncbi:MAG: hypothetical protein RRA92_00680 [Gemmatimonadota bacterium]|nr:hypothetical protein [Gemmatimonadota bacterium]
MRRNGTTAAAIRSVFLLALATWSAGCGDDDPTGPQFGDLVFEPSFADVGAQRDTVLVLRNTTSGPLGPVRVGTSAGGIELASGFVCPGMDATVAPASFTSIDAGAERQVTVSLDLSAVTLDDCPAGRYDVDVTAAVGDRGLASATIRLDWEGQG